MSSCLAGPRLPVPGCTALGWAGLHSSEGGCRQAGGSMTEADVGSEECRGGGGGGARGGVLSWALLEEKVGVGWWRRRGGGDRVGRGRGGG